MNFVILFFDFTGSWWDEDGANMIGICWLVWLQDTHSRSHLHLHHQAKTAFLFFFFNLIINEFCYAFLDFLGFHGIVVRWRWCKDDWHMLVGLVAGYSQPYPPPPFGSQPYPPPPQGVYPPPQPGYQGYFYDNGYPPPPPPPPSQPDYQSNDDGASCFSFIRGWYASHLAVVPFFSWFVFFLISLQFLIW